MGAICRRNHTKIAQVVAIAITGLTYRYLAGIIPRICGSIRGVCLRVQ